MNLKRTAAALALASTLGLGATACGSSTAADTVSDNIAKDAEQFKVNRRIVITNGITNEPTYEITGRCSFESYGDRFDVVCKEGPNAYTKNSFVRGDQDSAASVQLGTVDVDEYRTKIVFRPETMIPDFDLKVGEQG